MPKTLIDVNELSERLSVARGTLYNWVSQAKHGMGPFSNGEGRGVPENRAVPALRLG